MRTLRKLLTVFAVTSLAAGVFAGGGYLYAQPAAPDAPADDDVTVPMATQAELSPREMSDAARDIQTKMESLLQRVLALREGARTAKDVLKLNCVNEKLVQVKQLLNIGDEARNELTSAIASADDNERYHQFGRINIAFEKTTTLRDEAEGCIGEELVYVGPTTVDINKPAFPDDPTGDDPFNQGLDFERPAYATPYGS